MTDDHNYALVLGEALVDLLEGECAGERVYRPAIGGAPLNVAVGVARLGGAAQFAGSLGADLWGGRIRAFLRDAGVGDRNVVDVPVPTTLALTTFDGAEPDFQFYGTPPSYGQFGPDKVDRDLVAGAGALYCGSIALLCPAAREAARSAWATPGPLRAFDPNVRPRLLDDPAALRALVEEFAATADLVKLSAADAAVLYDAAPEEVAGRLADVGAGAVVVTLGADGALAALRGQVARVPAPRVDAVDATGAGDAAVAALVRGLLVDGVPADLDALVGLVRFAVAVAALTCERPGGAGAIPTVDEVRLRFPDLAG